MMKKVWKPILWICGVLLAGLLIWNFTDCATVTVDGQSVKVSFSESWRLRGLLVAKYVPMGVGCPFSFGYSVHMGGLTYCVAKDDCESVWIPELNIYYEVQEERFSRLEEEMLKIWEEQLRPSVSAYNFAAFEKKGEDGYKLITGEMSSLYTFDSLRLRPMMDYAPQGDWLYRIILGDGELEILFWENAVTVNGKACVPAEGVAYENVLNWAAGKYEFFDCELQYGKPVIR